MTNSETIAQIVNAARDQLAEHCDSVRIFVSYQSQDGESNTLGYTTGGGSLFAQHGQIREWLEMQEEYARIQARKDVNEGQP